MTNQRDDGGPAFPAPELGRQDYGQPGAYPGMSLRDYFAAKAMQALLSDPTCELDDLGDNAYVIADAMLEARKA
jgi:hypothetical protein